MIDVFNKLHCLKNNKLLIINSFLIYFSSLLHWNFACCFLLFCPTLKQGPPFVLLFEVWRLKIRTPQEIFAVYYCFNSYLIWRLTLIKANFFVFCFFFLFFVLFLLLQILIELLPLQSLSMRKLRKERKRKQALVLL